MAVTNDSSSRVSNPHVDNAEAAGTETTTQDASLASTGTEQSAEPAAFFPEGFKNPMAGDVLGDVDTAGSQVAPQNPADVPSSNVSAAQEVAQIKVDPSATVPTVDIDWDALGASGTRGSLARATAMAYLSRVMYEDIGTRDGHTRSEVWSELEKQGFTLYPLEREGTETVTDREGVEHEVDTSTQAMVLVRGDEVYVVFRGTEKESAADNKLIMEFGKDDTKQGGVHSGFNRGLDQVYPQLVERLTQLKQENRNINIHLTGHSLGAALATLAGARLTAEDGRLSATDVYGFGSPRVGNEAFRKKAVHSGLNRRVFRFENSGDSVTRLPPDAFSFVHVGNQLSFDAGGHPINAYIAWLNAGVEPTSTADPLDDCAGCIAGSVEDRNMAEAFEFMAAYPQEQQWDLATRLQPGDAARMSTRAPVGTPQTTRDVLRMRAIVDRVVLHSVPPSRMRLFGMGTAGGTAEQRADTAQRLLALPAPESQLVLETLTSEDWRSFLTNLRKEEETDLADRLEQIREMPRTGRR